MEASSVAMRRPVDPAIGVARKMPVLPLAGHGTRFPDDSETGYNGSGETIVLGEQNVRDDEMASPPDAV